MTSAVPNDPLGRRRQAPEQQGLNQRKTGPSRSMLGEKDAVRDSPAPPRY